MKCFSSFGRIKPFTLIDSLRKSSVRGTRVWVESNVFRWNATLNFHPSQTEIISTFYSKMSQKISRGTPWTPGNLFNGLETQLGNWRRPSGVFPVRISADFVADSNGFLIYFAGGWIESGNDVVRQVINKVNARCQTPKGELIVVCFLFSYVVSVAAFPAIAASLIAFSERPIIN